MVEKTQIAEIEESFTAFISAPEFPCILAKAAIHQNKVKLLVLERMNSEAANKELLINLYYFVDSYRKHKDLYQSFAVIFIEPKILSEDDFEELFWQELQALYEMDSKNYPYDKRVSSDPKSSDFSFSLKSEAFFVVGLNPCSCRVARRFKYPAIVFNLHEQFETLRERTKFENIRNAIRSNDEKLNGSVNKMLEDFGEHSESRQYTGKQYDNNWQCPLVIKGRK